MPAKEWVDGNRQGSSKLGAALHASRGMKGFFYGPAAKHCSAAKIKAGDHFHRRHTQKYSEDGNVSPTQILAEMRCFEIGPPVNAAPRTRKQGGFQAGTPLRFRRLRASYRACIREASRMRTNVSVHAMAPHCVQRRVPGIRKDRKAPGWS
jgi:hypothetical protein